MLLHQHPYSRWCIRTVTIRRICAFVVDLRLSWSVGPRKVTSICAFVIDPSLHLFSTTRTAKVLLKKLLTLCFLKYLSPVGYRTLK